MSPTHRRTGCSGSSTTARPTEERPPSNIERLAERRDLLLHHPTKSAFAQRLRKSRRHVQCLADFEERHDQTARPLRWKFTTTDLDEFLYRLDQHRSPTAPTQSSLTPTKLRAQPLSRTGWGSRRRTSGTSGTCHLTRISTQGFGTRCSADGRSEHDVPVCRSAFGTPMSPFGHGRSAREHGLFRHSGSRPSP